MGGRYVHEQAEYLKKHGRPRPLHDPQREPRKFCIGCLIMFPRKQAVGKPKAYCSEDCYSKRRVMKKCKSICREFIIVPVEFKDGSQHAKKVCKVCHRGNYTPRDESLSQRARVI